MPDLIFTP